MSSKPSDLVIYCTRPGARIWKASTSDGRVLNTLQYKELLSASFKMEPDLSQSEFLPRSAEGNIRENLKSSKQKSIAHNFSLLQCIKIKCPADNSSRNLLLTYNSIGIYLVGIDDMSNINFLRLAKKGGSISNIVVDTDFGNECDVNEENIRRMDTEDVSTNVYLTEIIPFPVYVINGNGFVERHIIQPHILSKDDSFGEIIGKKPNNISSNASSNFNVSRTYQIW